MITELKQPKSKSPKYIKNVLLDALKELEKGKVSGVAVAMLLKEEVYTDSAITPDGSYAELIGAVDSIKVSLKEEWDMEA